MAEELKEKIYAFLKKNVGKRFILKEISRRTKISYPTVLKWSDVLVAENNRNPPVLLEDYGHVKFIWVEKEVKEKLT